MRLPHFGAITPAQIKPNFAFRPTKQAAALYDQPYIFVVDSNTPEPALTSDHKLSADVFQFQLRPKGNRGFKLGPAVRREFQFVPNAQGQLVHKAYEPANVKIISDGEELEVLPRPVENIGASVFGRFSLGRRRTEE